MDFLLPWFFSDDEATSFGEGVQSALLVLKEPKQPVDQCLATIQNNLASLAGFISVPGGNNHLLTQQQEALALFNRARDRDRVARISSDALAVRTLNEFKVTTSVGVEAMKSGMSPSDALSAVFSAAMQFATKDKDVVTNGLQTGIKAAPAIVAQHVVARVKQSLADNAQGWGKAYVQQLSGLGTGKHYDREYR